MPIEDLFAWEVLDSRGNPTVACAARVNGVEAQAAVPSGASTGTHEAKELRDGDERYGGRGVRRAVAHVNERFGPAVVGLDARDQADVDATLVEVDGDRRFAFLGANGALAVSLAVALAAAAADGVPPYRHFAAGAEPLLPMPMINIVSGGAHAGSAVDVQDFLAIPVGATSFAEAVEWVWRVRRGTADVLRGRGHDVDLVADEGGLAARLPSNRDALSALCDGIARAGLAAGDEVAIAIDVAANQLWDGTTYRLATENRSLGADELVEELVEWCDAFPIISIEDAAADDDAKGWALAGEALSSRVQLLGDDLFVTDVERLQAGIRDGIANSVLVKPNQSGTLSSTRDVVRLAHTSGYATVLSARSGETEDSWLADLACGWRTGQIKVGSLTRSERTAKWNRLLRIEHDLGGPGTAPFAGAAALVRRA
ncbi:MAG: phosphopyruvate hydratase [Actinobacteria bacterium]|nr:phosphopyruvate hydratase [Actinomycetota bacterium]